MSQQNLSQFPNVQNFSQQFPNIRNFSQQFPNVQLTEKQLRQLEHDKEHKANKEHEANEEPFQLTEEQLRQLEVDEEVKRETEENELWEKAARREQEASKSENYRKNSFDILYNEWEESKIAEGFAELDDEGYNSHFSL